MVLLEKQLNIKLNSVLLDPLQLNLLRESFMRLITYCLFLK